MTQQTTQPSGVHTSLSEHILVVKRSVLFPTSATAWHGLKQENFTSYQSLITTHQEFMPRALMEQDPCYKQIIPYLIFRFQDSYFLMQRHAKATEVRLQNKCTLGIGGHVRKEDMNGASIFDWAQREFHEEIAYDGSITLEPLGILNDDSNDVGRVHLGLVLLLRGDSPHISIKSELQHGALVSLAHCKEKYAMLESWSQMVVDYLDSNNAR